VQGREHVTVLGAKRWLPAPWINVVANPSFGFQAAVEGSGYTWSLGSRENQVTAFVEWVLGPQRSASAFSVVTELDAQTGALLARNPWSSNFGSRVAFADLGGRQTAWTCDRREFLGRNGTLDNPAALAGETVLSKRVGAGLDPCAALQAPVELEPDGTAEIVFFLGQAASEMEVRSLCSPGAHPARKA
jgi:cyclic beta-1,2-glucan synthetase